MTTPVRSLAVVPVTHYRTIKVDGINLFYREAGATSAPAVLLLHGFPTSSHMFRNLIPALADSYRLIAPDYPGYGQSDMPDRSKAERAGYSRGDQVSVHRRCRGFESHLAGQLAPRPGATRSARKVTPQ